MKIDTTLEEVGISANRINLSSRTIILYDEIDMLIAKEISDVLPLMDTDRDQEITIKINSAGGDIFSVISIIAEIERCQNVVACDITGIAYSGAAMIALACDRISMSKYGLFMLHYPNWETDSKTLAEHKSDLTVTQEHFERIMKELLVGTKLTFKEFKEQVNNELYFTPLQCKKNEIVNEVY
jgi:ATP-dependent protease ClpP protease subunit